MILLATNEVNVDINDFNTNLKQNDPNYFCVEKKQDYTIVPNSCHIFEQEQYTYQMKNPLTLRIAIYTTITQFAKILKDPHGIIDALVRKRCGA